MMSARHHSIRAVGPWAGVVVLAFLLGWVIALPAIGTFRTLLDAEPGPIDRGIPAANTGVLLVRTLSYAFGISLISTLLAWPMAWATRSCKPRTLALLAAPLLLPPYLAYAGWNLLRAPMTPLGDWLRDLDLASLNAPVIAGRVLAVVGLSLWLAPVCAWVQRIGLRSIPDQLLDTLALDAGPLDRWRTRVRLARRSVLLSLLVGAVLMTGSAVPLHVAQVRTYAITIWLTLASSADPRAPWALAWPLVLVALGAAGWVLVRSARWTTETVDAEPSRSHASTPTVLAAMAVWAAGVLAPAVFFLLAIQPNDTTSRTARLIDQTVRLFSDQGGGIAIRNSLIAGGMVGTIGATLTLATWLGASSLTRPARVVTRVLMGLAVFPAVLPGILIGLAARQSGPPAVMALTIVPAHVARYGLIAIGIGWWLALQEERSTQDLRRLDDAGGLVGWCLACLPRGLAGLAASFTLMSILSFHEIEATVIVAPPGVETIAQQLLESLHFARDERLAVTGLWILLVGSAAAYGAAIVLARVGRWREV